MVIVNTYRYTYLIQSAMNFHDVTLEFETQFSNTVHISTPLEIYNKNLRDFGYFKEECL